MTLFNIGGYCIGAGLILFAIWNLAIMYKAIQTTNKGECKELMRKENVENDYWFLKPFRYAGYFLLIAGLLIYFMGYL